MPGAIPSGSDPSGISPTDFSLIGAMVGDLQTRDEAAVRAHYNTQMQGDPTLTGMSDLVFEGIDSALGLVGGTIKAILYKILGSVPLGTNVIELLDELESFFTNTRNFWGSIDFADPDFDLGVAWDAYFDTVINPTIKNVTGIDLNGIADVINRLMGGIWGDQNNQVMKWIESLFTGSNFFELETWVNALNLVTGFLSGGIIPPLDATKITTGFFEIARVLGLEGLFSAWGGTTSSGTNLVVDPGFQDPLQWVDNGGFNQGALSTEQAHSGNSSGGTPQSYKLAPVTPVGASFTSQKNVWFNTDHRGLVPYDEGAAWRVSPGQHYYFEAWVYGHAANVETGGYVFITAGFRNSISFAQTFPGVASLSAVGLKGHWTKLSGYYTVPVGYDRMMPILQAWNAATGSGDIYYVDDLMVREETAAQSIIAQLWGGLGAIGTFLLTGVIPSLDASQIGSGFFPEAQFPSLSDLRDIIKNATDMNAGFGWDDSALQQSLQNRSLSVAQQASDIARLQAENSSSTNSGIWYAEPFDFTGSIESDADWSGQFLLNTSAEGQLEADGVNAGGVRASTSAGDFEEMQINVASGATTLTDYQHVSTPLANTFAYFNDGFGDTREIRFHHYLRCNAAQTQWVRWQLRANPGNSIGTLKARLQYKNGGSVTNLGTEVTVDSLGATTTIDSYAGVLGADHTFQIFANGTLLHSVNDGGSVTAMSSTNRRGGFGVGYSANNFFLVQKNFPFINHWIISDNAPADVIGSMAQYTRLGTGLVSASNGNNLFPTSFFDNTTRVSPDITADLTNGKFTILKTGTYTLKASVKVGTSFTNKIALRLYTGGSPARHAGQDSARTLNGIGTSQLPRWIVGEWTFYAAAGTQIQLGYDSDGSSSNVFTGESGGLETYFNIGVANWSTK